ncbi:MAG: hypothetical protein IT168_10050 [Bryobacterales bacterium]|nr:hypothetical protein [Bryobacterales bacterium]
MPIFDLLLCLAMFPVDVTAVRPGPVQVTTTPQTLNVSWPDEQQRQWSVEFSRDPERPLIARIGLGSAVVERMKPLYWIEAGKRRGGFDQFFDFPPSHDEGTRRFMMSFEPSKGVARTIDGGRVEVRFAGLRLGIFSGAVAFVFFPGSRLIQQQAIVSTNEPDTAFYYDAGLEWQAPADQRVGQTMQTELTWYDTGGRLKKELLPFFASERHPVQAKYRALAMKAPWGSIATFPPPHQYFMPRDFTSNMGFVWAHSFRGKVGLGIRQYPDEHWVFYPWMNAPPGTEQRLSMFIQLSPDAPADGLEEVLRYTNRDRFPALSGYKTLASHWHFAYTVQAQQYGEQWAPPFKPVLKDSGIDIAMIADFHGDGHPRDTGAVRLKELDDYYRFTKAQTDDRFLLIPAEEANVHFGGHYVIAFPKPVRWIMSRAEGQPFAENGVYRVKDSAELLDLARRENALIYTAHPRTKGSLGFPDKYRDTEFFRDDHFFGAGWKQMPSNLSTVRLGIRSLNLLDDMLNWGFRKRLIGEVDVFQVDSTHDLYPHLNVNYVKLDTLPRYEEYGSALDAIKRGDFFISTGEVLLPLVVIRPGLTVTADIRWNFPLDHALIVWGDGSQTHREPVTLADTAFYGTRTFTWKANAPGARWARLEVWDVAGNGAMSTPVWFSR